MANVPGTFYTAETQRKGATPVSPPNADDDPQGPINGATVPPVAKRYTSQAIMIADQNNQLEGYLYFDGTDNWWYNGGTSGTIADYVAFCGGGGGPDTDAVHYSTVDGKNATQKQQARDNIGLDSGIPFVVTTDANINNLSRTSNLIIFSGATAIRSLTGMVAGRDGEPVLLWNQRAFNVTLTNNSSSSTAGNRLLIGVNTALGSNYFLAPGQKIGLIYSVTDNGWVFDKAGFDQYVSKKTADFKEYNLDIYLNGIANTNRIRMLYSPGGRTVIDGTRNGTYVPAIHFNNSSMYIGNDKGSSSIWGLHIEDGDMLHLGKNGNGPVTTLPTGYQVSSILGHYFYNDASALGLTIRPTTVLTAGSINDLSTGISSNLRFTAATDLTGVAFSQSGKRLIIQNDNTVSLNIPHQSGSSTAANRFKLIGGATLVIPADGKAEFIYSSNSSRWELLSKNF